MWARNSAQSPFKILLLLLKRSLPASVYLSHGQNFGVPEGFKFGKPTSSNWAGNHSMNIFSPPGITNTLLLRGCLRKWGYFSCKHKLCKWPAVLGTSRWLVLRNCADKRLQLLIIKGRGEAPSDNKHMRLYNRSRHGSIFSAQGYRGYINKCSKKWHKLQWRQGFLRFGCSAKKRKFTLLGLYGRIKHKTINGCLVRKAPTAHQVPRKLWAFRKRTSSLKTRGSGRLKWTKLRRKSCCSSRMWCS